MILVDSYIPMYLIGAPHPHKLDAQRLLESALAAGERVITDVEVLQEICHRYVAIGRRGAIQPAFDAILGVVDEVVPVEQADVESAKDILLGYGSLSARDALHLAVMRHRNVKRSMSFDRGLDAFPGVERVY